VPGTIARWLATDGADVSTGQPILLLDPSQEMVWEGLRALYLIGQPEDLEAIQPYVQPLHEVPDAVHRQAEITAEAIQKRNRENRK
jgi:hypothetical protein